MACATATKRPLPGWLLSGLESGLFSLVHSRVPKTSRATNPGGEALAECSFWLHFGVFEEHDFGPFWNYQHLGFCGPTQPFSCILHCSLSCAANVLEFDTTSWSVFYFLVVFCALHFTCLTSAINVWHLLRRPLICNLPQNPRSSWLHTSSTIYRWCGSTKSHFADFCWRPCICVLPTSSTVCCWPRPLSSCQRPADY